MSQKQCPLSSLSAIASLLFSSTANVTATRPQRRQPFPTHISHETDAHTVNSFAQRHNLPIPPLISRKTRRRMQSTENETESLDTIISEAKAGQDPNARLRNDLLWNTPYDRNSYPWEYAWTSDNNANNNNNNNTNLTGLPVEMRINFHRVYTVDVINPVLDLIVWFELTWIDPRLTWIPSEYSNHTKVWFWISSGGAGGETSEIWTPDIELWNLDQGLAESLEDSYAGVSYDGSVYWSRPGHLRPACKYRGLEKFPFDELGCTMELGSWVYSGKYVRLVKGGEDEMGFSIGGSQTAGESYNEFTFVRDDPITAEVHIYPQFEEGWPVMFYNVTLERAWQPYARGYIYSQVLISIIGFSAFWLPPSCGERMGLSITSMLASIASDIVIAGNLPQAKELTWFQKFSFTTSTFTFLALIESVVVLYFFYKRSEDCVPKWYTQIKEWRVVKKAQKRSSDLLSESRKTVQRTAARAKETMTNLETVMNLGSIQEGASDDEGEGSDVEPQDNGQRNANGRRGSLGMRNQFERAESSFLMRDVDDFLNEEEFENNLKWKRIAARVDDVSRNIFPLTYTIVLAVLLAEIF